VLRQSEAKIARKIFTEGFACQVAPFLSSGQFWNYGHVVSAGDGQGVMLDQRFFHGSVKGGFFIG
jgi:hypothetical protein